MTDRTSGGAFISTGQIYDKVLEVENTVIQLATLVKVLSLVIGPAISATVAFIVAQVMGGN